MTMALSPSTGTCSDYSQNDAVLGSTPKVQGSVADTYETYEDFLESAVMKCNSGNGMMVMNLAYSSDADFARKDDGSHASSSSMGQALMNNISAWCELTGLPTTITVHIWDRSFHLHKFPLITRSGYMKRMLMDSKEVKIPHDCPGGPDTFEIVANFCYGSTIQMDSSNVAELRCAGEYLQMTEEYVKGNLCERSDLYLSQVVLQSWQDSMLVLLHCQNLQPYAEDLRIVSRCVDALAFMACMEMVDPLERTARPGMSIESQFWSDISASTRDSSSPDWWMEDLLRLPCGVFERVIAAIRRQGMQEKYVSQAIVKFVDRWVFTSLASDAETTVVVPEEHVKPSAVCLPPSCNQYNLVEAVVRLLPAEKDAVPISFLFSLLRCALACGSSAECKNQLEARISSQLELATITDFLYPFKIAEDSCISAAEVSCMRRIVTSFMAQQRALSDCTDGLPNISADETPENAYCVYAVSAVAKVWDEYLAEVARDLSLSPSKFLELAEVIPSYARATHDHLYRAIHVYLKVHPQFSQEERQMVCRILNCQKLSQEMCTHAVQNELMPLRMIVQAMFMQQLQTRNVLSANLQCTGGSMRLDNLPPLSSGASFRKNSLAYHIQSESFRSTRESFQSRGDDSFRIDENELADGVVSLGYILKRDAAFRQAALLKADYEATETRLQSLEEELAFMKRKMDGTPVHVKCGSERLSRGTYNLTGGDTRSRKASGAIPQSQVLTAVPEASTNSDEDEAPASQIKLSARAGVGFLARALRVFALTGFRRRRGDGDAGYSEYSNHVMCSGRNLWPNEDNIKPRVRAPSDRRATAAVVDSSCGPTASASKHRHSRRHSLS
ncbi:hypothetical protein MPTK1_2g13430 [Marchantia polymorpha subsp. ruderalis]|uniref:NPH3 domain-containing protein n=2 Tax=Marchantia polymorpha TaxID=3197 RepID=A0A176VRF7_MARPO|nr:hypothetical protein AXG93_731s1280 [Marchantia polymorpha subsp. ruderalis]PTQ43137.1 hypothetical protein MARPO_0026s0028 [Marchantia polymorpha]BAV53286.1 non-phototropic hypocotyl 3-like protein [Marchantia polymorpha]BBN02181.1 hypothetical protein Mp_2g13430 [Marchantia polymorpha subsp. ruderalis]|eukprot:PTQ43137.1 hypothetical protein MARPO_0026s0028 [Marchantia polymorpha]